MFVPVLFSPTMLSMSGMGTGENTGRLSWPQSRQCSMCTSIFKATGLAIATVRSFEIVLEPDIVSAQ